ncbi:hypothetical protein K501DRAFT_273529 [Backusella circina FSU 941]|nr:hypothetical protein K501DRAFT_273529 [Backusella circina FSU 941]
MPKTRSQTKNFPMKKEKLENSQRLNGVRNTRGNKDKIAKRKASTIQDKLLSVPNIKIEENTDDKSLLETSSKFSKLKKINQLIHYVVNCNMSLCQATKRLKIQRAVGSYYYHLYNNHPKKKIPKLQHQPATPKVSCTTTQRKKLIQYIIDDKMSVIAASAKVDIPYRSALVYYNKYVNGADYDIPIANNRIRTCTQDQIKRLIGYMTDGKTTILAASLKTGMCYSTARKYYKMYLNNPDHEIPIPSIRIGKRCPHFTQTKIHKVLGYIINDKMSIAAASRKANMSYNSVTRHYNKFENNPNRNSDLFNPPYIHGSDFIKECIGYMINDKMTFRAASNKAKIAVNTYRKYNNQHINKCGLTENIRDRGNTISQDKINELLHCIKGYLSDQEAKRIQSTICGKIPIPRAPIKVKKLRLLKKKETLLSENNRSHTTYHQVDTPPEQRNPAHGRSKDLMQPLNHLEEHLKGGDGISQEVTLPDQHRPTGNSESLMIKHSEQQSRDKDNTINLLTQTNEEHKKKRWMLVRSKEIEILKTSAQDPSFNMRESSETISLDDHATITTKYPVVKSPTTGRFRKTYKKTKTNDVNVIAGRLRSRK